MNTLRIATSASLAVAWVFLAPLAYAAGQPEQSTSDQVMKSQSDDRSATKNKGADGKAQSGSTAKNGAPKAPAAKHPPTAVMDRATSTDKSAAESNKTAAHGPTSVMDRAAPDQKSPGAASQGPETPAK